MSERVPVQPAGWFADPSGAHEYRYWDGSGWTDHVATGGRQSVAEVRGPMAVPTTADTPERIRRQVERSGVVVPDPGVVADGLAQPSAADVGGGTIFTEPILVVNQKVKIVELTNEYAIFDGSGRQLGAVRQVGQSAGRKALRLLTSIDQFLTHRLQVVDQSGQPLLTMTRPAKLVKSKVLVADGAGRELGTVRQENAIGKIRFALEVDGQRIGGIQAENWRAWNFSIRDAEDTECARVTKTWEGLAKTMFTTADNYVLQIHRPLEDPLRSLVVASALCIDTALKQDQRGLG